MRRKKYRGLVCRSGQVRGGAPPCGNGLSPPHGLLRRLSASMPGSPLTLFIVDTHSATPPTVIRTPPSATPAPRGSASVPAIPLPPYQPGASASPVSQGSERGACTKRGGPASAARLGRSEHGAAQAQVATRPANVTARMVRGVLNVCRSAGAATQAIAFS
jgi:hypothetical protein